MENNMAECSKDTEQMMWITQAKNGSRVAFNHIVEEYQQPIYNFCYRMLNNGNDAEDAAQEVFLRAYIKLDSYAETYKFSTWLFSIASHYCIDRLRKRRFQSISWDDLAPWYRFPSQDSAQPEGTLLKAETGREVRGLLTTLSPDYRTVIILKYWHGMSYQDIAQTLGTTASAIRSKLFRARRMMADQIGITSRRDRADVSSQMVFNSPGKMSQLKFVQ
jgi:RNA polymerase sigma-70 factor (ECF subfamily)